MYRNDYTELRPDYFKPIRTHASKKFGRLRLVGSKRGGALTHVKFRSYFRMFMMSPYCPDMTKEPSFLLCSMFAGITDTGVQKIT